MDTSNVPPGSTNPNLEEVTPVQVIALANVGGLLARRFNSRSKVRSLKKLEFFSFNNKKYLRIFFHHISFQ